MTRASCTCSTLLLYHVISVVLIVTDGFSEVPVDEVTLFLAESPVEGKVAACADDE